MFHSCCKGSMRFTPYWRDRPEDAGRVSMFDTSFRPALRARVYRYLLNLIVGSAMLWTGMSIFLGAGFKKSVRVDKLHVELFDLDHESIGGNITQLVLAEPRNRNNVTWRVRSGFSNLNEAKKWVKDHGWGGVVINEGATQRLLDAIRNDDKGYDPNGALTILESTGRHPSGTNMFVNPALINFASKASLHYSTKFLEAYKTNPAFSSVLAANNGRLSENHARILIQPIGYRQTDVGPYSFPLSPIAYLFSFLVLMLCFLGMAVIWKSTSFQLLVTIKARHLALWFLAMSYVWALILGLFAALGYLAFKSPEYNTLHQALPFTFGRFVCLALTNCTVVLAIGLWLLNWFFVLTPEYVPMLSVTTVVSNVATLVIPVELAPHFFRWFYATPSCLGAILYRYIISGAYPKLGLALGVILGEIALMSILMFFTVTFRQYTVLMGIADISGWFRGSMFFRSPIPYYKDVRKQRLPEVPPTGGAPIQIEEPRDTVPTEDFIGGDATLRDGNLGV